MAGHRKFRDLERKGQGDPGRPARVAAHKRAALGEIIGHRLRELRQQQGKTQVQLAGEMAVAQSRISDIESNEDILYSTLLAFVEGLGGELMLVARIDGEEIPIVGG